MTVTRKARDRSLRVPEMCYFRGDAVMDRRWTSPPSLKTSTVDLVS